MKVCPNCFKVVDDKAKFCPECGYDLRATEARFEIDQEKPSDEPSSFKALPTLNSGSRFQKILNRTLNILLNPKKEWELIEAEKPGRNELLRSYILPLSLIPFLVSVLFYSLISTDHSITYTLVKSVIAFILPLIVIYLSAWVLDKIAPSFESEADFTRSFQLVGYAFTPVWVFSIFSLIPWIYWFIHLAAFAYIIYQLITALPLLRKIPRENTMGVAILLVIIMFAAYLVIGQIITQVAL